jgi:hypothetical protein
MTSRYFTWLATDGGAWSLAANWDDVTDGIDPSLVSPGPQDSIGVTGPSGSILQTMTGQGSVLSAAFTGNTALSGTFAASSLTLGASGGGGLLTEASGSLNAGTLDISSGSVLASGASNAVSVSGQLSLGDGSTGNAACNLDATSGADITAGTLVLGASAASIYVDPASSLEVGTVGGAALGVLTVDADATLTGQGNANAYGALVNNGTIAASTGVLMLGDLGGTGALDIGAGATLDLNGATGPGQSVAFTGADATLAVGTEFDQPQGTISLFAPGDAIDMLGSPISAATYAWQHPDIGVLTLWYGSQVADKLTLYGNYSGDVFLTAGDGGLGTLITVAPETGGTGSASPGTTSPDQYQWVAAGSSNWNYRLNWSDVTRGADPAGISPGVNDLVSIDAANAGSFVVIAGPANAASLSLGGDVALVGAFDIGTLTVGSAANMAAATLDLLPNTTLTTPGAAIQFGEISVSGSALLAVAGTLVLGGGAVGVGLPTTDLSATAGGTITAEALTLGGGSGDDITTDPTGVIEIGSTGGAAPGGVTIDAGATLGGNGSINPFGDIFDNGMLLATGGTLTIGAVTGTGLLDIGAAAVLGLNADTSMSVSFGGAGGELQLANELVALTGTLSGFAQGDAIDIQIDPITALRTSSVGGNTVLGLYYGSVLVNRLTLAGSFSGEHFVLAPDGAGGTEILLSGGGGGGGGGGQGDTDLLVWKNPVSGAWDSAANWFDSTTGSQALAAPGARNSVQIVGPTGVAIQTIGGPGLCANLAFFGNSLITRAFIAGTLSIGGMLSGTLTAGAVDVTNVGASASLTATAQASIIDGTLDVGSGGALVIDATLMVGDGVPGDSSATSELNVTSSGTALLAGLALGGGAGATVQTDATGVIEVGSAGGAVAGAVTIDTGIAAGGSGDINVGGLVVVNGTLTAAGGTLAVGAVSGTGTLCIATEATLALSAADLVPIAFAGAGATLLLQGSEEDPAAPILGFTQGDAIVTGSSQVSNVTYAPGTGEVGTLALYNGTTIAGTLLIGGDFAGDVFTVQPDGGGSEIAVQPSSGGGSGPSQGTPTPDAYVWLGGDGTGWNSASNWKDVSAGQDPALIAPGAHDLDTVQGGTSGTYSTIVGPANAAALSLFGSVALSGTYALGSLTVGGPGGAAGVLALSSGAVALAEAATIYGDMLADGASLSTTGLLAVSSGALVVTQGALVQSGTLALSGTGATITVDATSAFEVGTADDATQGDLTVDADAVLSGAGTVDPVGNIVVTGTITASGGTLTLGDVSGAGTLLVGVAATLALDGTADAATLIDFAGPGTLDVLAAMPAAGIADFGDGDQIVLPITGVTDCEYAVTGPNVGVLSLLSNGSVLATLNLVGVGQGQSFAASATDGGTIITTQTTAWGGGGGSVGNGNNGSSSGSFGLISGFGFWAALPLEAQTVLGNEQAQHGNEAWVDTSTDGTQWDDSAVAVANFAVLSDPDPLTTVGMPAGYTALLAQGGNPVWLTDGGTSEALLVGNDGNDTISGNGENDTMVGAGGNTLFFAARSAVIYGAGNDTIITGEGNDAITTASNMHSIVWLGPEQNNVVSQGDDTVLAGAGNGANDTISIKQADLVFCANVGLTTVLTGNGASTVVAGAGTLEARGGAGNGSYIWGGKASYMEFFGGGGSAYVFGGAGDMSVQGGGGALTVFGGTGENIITGAPGPSVFVVGDGATTVTAAAGNRVWLAGAANDSLIAAGGNILLQGISSSGDNVFQAGSGPCTIYGGHGNDTFVGGAGTAIIIAGNGGSDFSFTNGLAGGSDTISNFDLAADQIVLNGYGAYNDSLVNGSEVISLSDGTLIQLNGIGSMSGVNIT